MNQLTYLRVLTLIAFALTNLAFLSGVNAQIDNTFFGTGAGTVNTGSFNSGFGFDALHANISGSSNTATGSGALSVNTSSNNTATGSGALVSNTKGSDNTATGSGALVSNTKGSDNTGTGLEALGNNTTGSNNTASGVNALLNNTTISGVAGNFNTADGFQALLGNTTGSSNTALGTNAGRNLTTGSGNVCIGTNVFGVAGESNTTRIRNIFSSVASAKAVFVNSDNKIGTLPSSARFKEEIKPMNKASETILALKPVTFRYKPEVDPAHAPMFGLIAEEVEKVDPDLVTRNDKGEAETVRYEAVNAMLLNEFIKEHKAFLEEERKVQGLEAALAAVNERLKAQDAKIDKVNAKVELTKPAPQTVLNQ